MKVRSKVHKITYNPQKGLFSPTHVQVLLAFTASWRFSVCQSLGFFIKKEQIIAITEIPVIKYERIL